MSHTEIYAVFPDSDGRFVFVEEFANSHGGAAFIWDALVLEYLGLRLSGVDCHTRWGRLWTLLREGKMSEFHENILRTTMDRAVIEQHIMGEIANEFKDFADEQQVGEMLNHACSLREQAKVLRNLEKKGALYAAWNQSTIGEFWGKDYNINESTNHIIIGINW